MRRRAVYKVQVEGRRLLPRSSRDSYDRVDENHHTTAAMAAKKMARPITMERFTLVVRLCTFTSGSPELSFSMDMRLRQTPLTWLGADGWPIQKIAGTNNLTVRG